MGHKSSHVSPGNRTRFEPEVTPTYIHKIFPNGVISFHDRCHIWGHIRQPGPLSHEFRSPKTGNKLGHDLGLMTEIMTCGIRSVGGPGIHVGTTHDFPPQGLNAEEIVVDGSEHGVEKGLERFLDDGLQGQHVDGQLKSYHGRNERRIATACIQNLWDPDESPVCLHTFDLTIARPDALNFRLLVDMDP